MTTTSPSLGVRPGGVPSGAGGPRVVGVPLGAAARAEGGLLGAPPTVSVLVVDDHALLADSVARALRDDGFAASAVHPACPNTVTECAARLWPAVTLLDLDLGSTEFNGLDLVAPLAALGSAVVALTDWHDRLLLAAALEAGAMGMVAKSEPFAAMTSAVRLAAAGGVAVGPSEREALRDELRERRAAHAERLAPFDKLTLRERHVLGALVEGRSAAAIAASAHVSLPTVRSQIRAVLAKLHVRSQLAAVAYANRCGWSAEMASPLARYSPTLAL